MIGSDDDGGCRGGLGNHKEATFNLREITKGSSGWQDAPGVMMLLLWWKELPELRCGGQLLVQTQGLTGGRVRTSDP